jgi:ABC-type transport system involved in multi-copper enzyme maturation permease subunit
MPKSLLLPIIRFELRFHFRRISTYVYFASWLVLGVLLISLPEGRENAVLNSPPAIAQNSGGLMAFGVIILSAICGMAVCRDFEDETYQVFFTTPMRRKDYLLGRLIGALLVSLFVFSGITLGLLIGTVMPWADRIHMDPIRLWVYVQPYLLFIATTVCWAGALFFAVGALSRRIVFVYLQGVLFVALYLGVQRLLGNLNDYWVALFDPFGFGAANQVTKYWTLAETNSRMIPLAGALLWNRLIWFGVGLAAVIAVLKFFPFSVEALGKRRSKRQAGAEDPSSELNVAPAPRVDLHFGWRTTVSTFLALTRLRAGSILTDLPFLAIAFFTAALGLVIGWGAPRIADTPVYPVTYLMTDNIGTLMIVVITAMYAGELVWRERSLKFDQVYDALPMPSWLNFTSQLAALVIVQIVIVSAMIVAGIVQQVAQGYFHFELALYFKELFLIELSSLALFAVLAIFLQTIFRISSSATPWSSEYLWGPACWLK